MDQQNKLRFHPFSMMLNTRMGLIPHTDQFFQAHPTYPSLTMIRSGHVFPDWATPALIADVLRKTNGSAMRLSQLCLQDSRKHYHTKVGQLSIPFEVSRLHPYAYELDFIANGTPLEDIDSASKLKYNFDLHLKAKLSYWSEGAGLLRVWKYSLLLGVEGEHAPTTLDESIPRLSQVFFNIEVPDDYVIPSADELAH